MRTPADPSLERVHRHLRAWGGASFSLLKPAYFARRLRTRWRARGVADPARYADVLDQDPMECTRLAAALAIGVTGFFRNPEAWTRLRALLAVELIDRVPRVWSAGCATGEEAWSSALLLASLGEGAGRGRVDGTDLDPASLEVARRGSYPARVLGDIRAVLDPAPGEMTGAHYQVPAALRTQVVFSRADLTMPPVAAGYDLVLCRNVLIYFTVPAQEQILTNLLGALRDGGLLMLGKAELAGTGILPRLEVVDRRERIYRRVG